MKLSLPDGGVERKKYMKSFVYVSDMWHTFLFSCCFCLISFSVADSENYQEFDSIIF